MSMDVNNKFFTCRFDTGLMIIIAAFDEAPISVEVPVGSEAVFRCRHSTADIIRWRVNETLLGNNRPTDITSESDSLVYTLTIEARLDYNGTTIVCVARFDDGSPDETSQPPAVLRVQGEIYTCILLVLLPGIA